MPSGELRFLTTGVYGLVKFSITFCFSVFIVDFIGRRRSLFTGISLQIITLTFVGAYVGVTTGMRSEEIEQDPNLSRTSTAAIVAIFFHAVGWSIGWFSMPYLINSDIFPTRIRSFNMSIFMALHWAWYFGCSKLYQVSWRQPTATVRLPFSRASVFARSYLHFFACR